MPKGVNRLTYGLHRHIIYKYPVEWMEIGGVFSISRSLARGYLFPYLFVLGIEKLTHMILDRVRGKKWRGIRVGQRGPQISHMMFADDLVLFAEPNTNQIDIILKCLQGFEDMSGLRISQEKTFIYFSPNTTAQLRRDICRRSKFNQVEELGRYMGTSISFPKRIRDKFKTTAERMQICRNGWQASRLSLEGKVTLIKSITSSMALRPMQHDSIPKGIIEEMEKEQRTFLWGEKEGERRRHAVA